MVGLPCTAFPVVTLCKNGWRPNDELRDWFTRYRAPVLVMILSMLGGLAFFAYCRMRCGCWDLYILTQESGWTIDAEYLAIFRPDNYRFALLPLYDSIGASQLVSAVAGAIFVAIAREIQACGFNRSPTD
jgi:hypothetical protein